PSMLEAAPIAQASITHARKRVIGPASTSANSTPSGVRMTNRRWAVSGMKRLVVRNTRSHQEKEQREKLDAAKRDFHRIRQHRLVVLREERLDDSGPHEQYRRSSGEGEQVFGNRTHAFAPRCWIAPAN